MLPSQTPVRVGGVRARAWSAFWKLFARLFHTHPLPLLLPPSAWPSGLASRRNPRKAQRSEVGPLLSPRLPPPVTSPRVRAHELCPGGTGQNPGALKVLKDITETHGREWREKDVSENSFSP